jgi:mannose-1-phosphate guanylyltransferase
MGIETNVSMREGVNGDNQREQSDNWAIVLAGGDGSRLRPVMRRLYGHDLPKQFAALNSDKTLLQQTMARLRPLVRRNRTIVVVAEAHESLAKTQLAEFTGAHIVAQPENLGTGPGLLLPLSVIRARCPNAMVMVTPSDHVISGMSSFLVAARRAFAAAPLAPSGLAVVGAEADRPASDLGWIVPRGLGMNDAPDVDWVEVFVEKPSPGIARGLLQRGGLWNTLIVAGSIQSFWTQAQRHMPHQTMLFTSYAECLAQGGETADGNRMLLRQIYQSIPAADFSRTVLQKAKGMAVVKMKDSGWSDCGTPERLITSLARARHLPPQWTTAVRRAALSQLPGPLSHEHGA